MTDYDLKALRTLETEDYLVEDLKEQQVEVPREWKPPDIEESEALPSQIHPSYLYGNPFSLNHPASAARMHREPHSRALFQDSGYGKGGKNDNLQWKDLALHELLPVDRAKEEAEKSAQARKMASGAAPGNSGAQQQPEPPAGPDQTLDDDDEDGGEGDDESGEESGEGEDEDEDENMEDRSDLDDEEEE
ncbi:hypothetical protein GLOTRDRAFT_105544 [Gloeophyllum trabeum ATCC 11539]|uniref:Uncharacterized protein n=1 Tax=Gloeophyllum trabeum (strain ATCC 11539 / FP-39264 / Madison 617) TaxID=670483 RepID=S7QBK4_GLOTA|nr:uncharacterized protein GLOTRDRAFT_105544 [Gloeophyllum trabeum ATCC 11539]EPQ56738.1 hypothetical protein GLOTRDRAFT_105544 [Gloeophyllum trabeum ATCC 11539]